MSSFTRKFVLAGVLAAACAASAPALAQRHHGHGGHWHGGGWGWGAGAVIGSAIVASAPVLLSVVLLRPGVSDRRRDSASGADRLLPAAVGASRRGRTGRFRQLVVLLQREQDLLSVCQGVPKPVAARCAPSAGTLRKKS